MRKTAGIKVIRAWNIGMNKEKEKEQKFSGYRSIQKEEEKE